MLSYFNLKTPSTRSYLNHNSNLHLNWLLCFVVISLHHKRLAPVAISMEFINASAFKCLSLAVLNSSLSIGKNMKWNCIAPRPRELSGKVVLSSRFVRFNGNFCFDRLLPSFFLRNIKENLMRSDSITHVAVPTTSAGGQALRKPFSTASLHQITNRSFDGEHKAGSTSRVCFFHIATCMKKGSRCDDVNETRFHRAPLPAFTCANTASSASFHPPRS